MIGVTGASGHLGSALLDMLPDAEPIGREFPDRPLKAIIHCAAPDYRDDRAVLDFRAFNAALEEHLRRHPPEVLVVTGSWWQHAEGDCGRLLYTMLKNEQARTFGGAVHLLPFSIYGDEPRPRRGFVPQLVQAVRGEVELLGLSSEPRDFVHVGDAALAHIRALDAPPGTYLVGTGRTISPRELAGLFGVTAPEMLDVPSAIPRYLAPGLPGWDPTVDVVEHVASLA